MSEMRWNDADADESQEHLDETDPCARCGKPGALYDGRWPRPEGDVCWPCVDAEPEPRRCAKCHLDIPEHFICDGSLGEKCPNYPLEDA